jgi:hypothetical protein
MTVFGGWSQPVDATLYLEGEMEMSAVGRSFLCETRWSLALPHEQRTSGLKKPFVSQERFFQRYRHKADVPLASTNARCWGNSGHVLEMPPLPLSRKRARPNSALTLDDHFRPDYTESVLAIRYLSGEISVGSGADSFPENGRYTPDGVGAGFICTRKSTPSPVLLQSSIQVLMKKEKRHGCRIPD